MMRACWRGTNKERCPATEITPETRTPNVPITFSARSRQRKAQNPGREPVPLSFLPPLSIKVLFGCSFVTVLSMPPSGTSPLAVQTIAFRTSLENSDCPSCDGSAPATQIHACHRTTRPRNALEFALPDRSRTAGLSRVLRLAAHRVLGATALGWA